MSELIEEVKSISLNDSRQRHDPGYIGTLDFDQLEDSLGKGIKIPQDILRSLVGGKLNFTKPSKIQEQSIPRILSNFDLIAQAQPGAGKTLAFAIGMILKVDVNIDAPQAICLTPTRELAVQIVINALQGLMSEYPKTSKKPTLRLALNVDRNEGVSDYLSEFLIPRLRKKDDKCVHQIIVGTPGTIATWAEIKQGKFLKQNDTAYLNLSKVKILVIDEADSMIGDGSNIKDSLIQQTFDIKRSVELNTDRCQYLFFSATFTDDVIAFGKALLGSKLSVVKLNTVEAVVLDNVKQYRLNVGQNFQSNLDDSYNVKLNLLLTLYKMNLTKAIIFCKTKEQANDIEDALKHKEYICSELSRGDMTEEYSKMEDFCDKVNVRVSESNFDDCFNLKLNLLLALYKMNLRKTIIFCKTKAQANDIESALNANHLICSVLHSGKSGIERDSTMNDFRNNVEVRVLITTDVLARGVDIPEVSAVIDFELPVNNYKVDPICYIHRVGRCSRFGTRGVAINLLYGKEDEERMYQIEQHYKYTNSKRMTELWDISNEKMSFSKRMHGLNMDITEFCDKKITKIEEVQLIEIQMDELIKQNEIIKQKNEEEEVIEEKTYEKTI